jgi:hypothetical protein
MKNTLFVLSMGIAIFFAGCKKDNSPSNITATNVSGTASTGSWHVTYFLDDNSDHTADLAGFVFGFSSSHVLTAIKADSTITGSWSAGNDDSKVKLVLSFVSPSLFEELSEDWQVIELTSTKIRLQHISGGNGNTDYLTFEKS